MSSSQESTWHKKAHMEWDPKVKVLDNSDINLGHQENARIWSELENYLALTKEAGKRMFIIGAK